MRLSNTATPKYYGEFRDKVLRGEIPVCETISMEMNRIDNLIGDPNIYYDPIPVEGWIKFCECELTLTDGSELHLLDTFKLWGEQVFCWYYFTKKNVYRPYDDRPGGRYVIKTFKKRLINKQYLIVARGGAKTIYDECIQAYGLIVDGETTHQAVTAPVMRQAEEILAPLKTAIARARGPLFKFLTAGTLQNTMGARANRTKLAPTKKGIENFITNSIIEVYPMSIDKLQSLRNKYSSVDEWLSGRNTREDVIGALEQGASKLEDYLIVATSSEGTVRNGVGDTIKIELMDILKGEYDASNVSIFWYRLDNIKEVNDPDMWVKAQPNIGITIDYDVYQRDVERAEKSPSARNDILAKRFGLPMEGFTYFFTYEETLPHRKRFYRNQQCAIGSDLSQGDDFCAFTFMFPLRKGLFGIKVRAYITERTLIRLPKAMRDKYESFIAEGTLMIMDGTVLEPMDVYDDLIEFIDSMGYEPITHGYDPYGAKEFIERWIHDFGPFGVEKVPQGAKTETIPLGELKAMAEDRVLLFDEELMSFCMGNAVVQEDSNGNRKLYKKRREEKIDNVSAMLDAYVSIKRHPDVF